MDLEKQLKKLKKISKEKMMEIDKHNKRQLNINNRKKVEVKKEDSDNDD